MTAYTRLHALLVDDDSSAQVCRDLPESACREQPRNYGVHVVSLSLTKLGDGLADPKLVLAWLLDAVGAPTWALGLLVPVRESLAMLPQLVISARIRLLPIRKTVYVVGCVVQAAAIIGFGLLGWFAQGASGTLVGIVAVALIAAFALGRSLCSISFKDVLGKTVDIGRRGSVWRSAIRWAGFRSRCRSWRAWSCSAASAGCWPRSSSDPSTKSPAQPRVASTAWPR